MARSRVHSVAQVVNLIKANSSGWMHKTFPEQAEFAWQTGYGAFAVSQSNVAAVKAYIARQKEHHQLSTFQDEFREFLRRHDLEWDERYVWD